MKSQPRFITILQSTQRQLTVGENRKCSAHTAWVRLHYRRQDTWYGVIKEDVLMESRSRRNSTRWTEEVNPVLDARTSSTRNQMINYTVKRVKTNATLNQNNLHGKPELGETVTRQSSKWNSNVLPDIPSEITGSFWGEHVNIYPQHIFFQLSNYYYFF